MTRMVGLVAGTGWHVQDLTRAAKNVGIAFTARPFPTLSAVVDGSRTLIESASDLADYDAVLVRMMPPGSLEQVVYRMDALHALEARGCVVINPPRAVETAVDKFLALARLQAAGLTVPETWVGESSSDALDAFDRLGGDVVVKPLFGSEGRGLVRLTDRETAGRVFRALERVHSVLYVQRFIPSYGYDLRAFVIGDRVVAAARRRARPGEWRANLSQGAQAEPIALDAATGQLARAAAAAVGAQVAGVDLLPAKGGQIYALEVNAVPGWRGLSKATGIDIAAEILVFARRRAEAR